GLYGIRSGEALLATPSCHIPCFGEADRMARSQSHFAELLAVSEPEHPRLCAITADLEIKTTAVTAVAALLSPSYVEDRQPANFSRHVRATPTQTSTHTSGAVCGEYNGTITNRVLREMPELCALPGQEQTVANEVLAERQGFEPWVLA